MIIAGQESVAASKRSRSAAAVSPLPAREVSSRGDSFSPLKPSST